MTTGRFLVLALAIGVVSCTSGAAPESEATSGTTADADAAPAATVVTAEDDSLQSEQNGLPEGYELVSGATVARVVPPGSSSLRTVVVVGPTPSDPRFVEYTLFALSDDTNADAATEMVGLAETSPVVDFADGAFAFVSVDTPQRSELQLLTYGPSIDATFRAVAEAGVVGVGGSASLQPTAIEDLVRALSAGETPAPDVLPQKMSVLIDGVLPDGRSVDLTSVYGTTSVIVYDGVGREWFDYSTWGDPDIPTPVELTDLAQEVSLQPPTNYGLTGATDPARITIWHNDRLTIIEQPDAVPLADTRALAARLLDEQAFDALLAESGGAEPTTDANAEPAEPTPDRPAAEAPSEQDLAAFQEFVETRLGIELGQPIKFNYVPDFPTEGIDFDFISSELWLVATALGLTDDGQTFEEANQSRIDAIRGTPGVIAIQPTQTETDVVTVHEMVHVLAPPVAAEASAEPFSMGQLVSEGNAHRIAYDYLLTLDAEERAIMEPFPHIFSKGGDPRISPAVQDLLEFAYDEGRVFMAAAAEDGGEARVAEVHRRPPTSTEQVLFFDAWLRDDQPTAVATPAVPTSATTLGQGSLGVFLLLLVATDADSADEARQPLQAWSGDSYVLYETGTQTCLAAAIEFDSSAAASDLGVILEAAAASVDVEAQTVDATFCN